MIENICGKRKACDVCGSTVWVDAHYTADALVCAACCAEIRRAQEARRPKQMRLLAQWPPPHPPRGARP